MVMGAYARKHSRYHRSVECETDGALQILWNLWKLHRFAKVLQICETGVMEKQETQRPNVLADVEEIYEYPKDTSTGVSKDISEKCLLGKWLIEEPYALIGHVRFCEGLLRLEPLIAKQYMMKGCEKSRQSLLDDTMANTSAVYARIDTNLKDNAESILSQLGISPSSAIQMLYSQIVLKKGMPFELKLPSSKPLAVGAMTREELDAELQKGVDSIKEGKVYSADEVDAVLAKEFGI